VDFFPSTCGRGSACRGCAARRFGLLMKMRFSFASCFGVTTNETLAFLSFALLGLVRRAVAVSWIQSCEGLAWLLRAKLDEPRMSPCLSVDSALARLQELRQIRGAHVRLLDGVCCCTCMKIYKDYAMCVD
jgi:hypothetical protein